MCSIDTTLLARGDTAYYYKVSGQPGVKPMDWSLRAASSHNGRVIPVHNEKQDIELIGEIYGVLFLALALLVLAIPRVKRYFASAFNLRTPSPTRSILKSIDEQFIPYKDHVKMREAQSNIQKALSATSFNFELLESTFSSMGIAPGKESMHLLKAMDNVAYLEMDTPTLKFLENFLHDTFTSQALYSFSHGVTKPILKPTIFEKYKLEIWITNKFKPGDVKGEVLAHGIRKFFENPTLDITYLDKLINTAGIDFDIHNDDVLSTMHAIPWVRMTDELSKHIIGEIKHIFSFYNQAYQPHEHDR